MLSYFLVHKEYHVSRSAVEFSLISGRYTAENSVQFGAPRNTDHPELRQPLAFEVWRNIAKQLKQSEKITVLTNGPLTNLANIVLSDTSARSTIEVSCYLYLLLTKMRIHNKNLLDYEGNI